MVVIKKKGEEERKGKFRSLLVVKVCGYLNVLVTRGLISLEGCL